MKKILFLLAAVSALFTACNNDQESIKIFDDHSAELAGTWTCLAEGFAEALVISPDGSLVATGILDGDYWEDITGNVTINEGKITLAFENGQSFEGHFDIIHGQAFSINTEKGGQLIFKFCPDNLADKLIGMWVATDGPMNKENDMVIQTYQKDGYSIKTGWSDAANNFIVNNKAAYKVVGDLVFVKRPTDILTDGTTPYVASRLIYTPNGTAFGDIMTLQGYMANAPVSVPFLRVKEGLNLASAHYDYSNIYVTNSKGLDQDFVFGDQNLNFAEMDGSIMNKMMKNLLFNIDFISAKSINYNCFYDGKSISMEAPIEVEGNKITIMMSARNAAYRDIEVYAFQDANDHQLHMYMPTHSYENFFANISVVHLADKGELDINDAEAVGAIFDGVDNAIESINVSLIFKSAK